MIEYGLPLLFALFVWWFSTGVVFFLDGLPGRTYRWSMVGGTAVFGLSLYGLWATAGDTSLLGAYLAFTCGVLIWGWQEMSFFLGYVTGPRKTGCPPGCTGFRRFVLAAATCIWHELAIVATAVVALVLTWGAPNQIGLWTFMLLWAARQSAKFNVFLGVRNLSEEFLPGHLKFLLDGFMVRKPMNMLFPLSVTALTLATAWLAHAAMAPDATAAETAGAMFLAAMMGLALLEHWFLVLPIPAAALWHWALPADKRPGAPISGNRNDRKAALPAE